MHLFYKQTVKKCPMFVTAKLSAEGLAAHSPRLSPDKDYLVWLQRTAKGPHHAAHQLVKQVIKIT